MDPVVGGMVVYVVLGASRWLIHCVRACVVEELEGSRVNSVERVENKGQESVTQWLGGDVLQVLGDFVLVCMAHGKVDIFQGTGDEIQFLN